MKKTGRPVYGVMTDPSRDIVKEVGKASRIGFDFVELGMEIPEGHHDILRKKRRGILNALKTFKYPPVAHSAYWVDLWSDYEEVRQAWIRIIKKNIDIAASLGCEKFNIHAPILHGLYNCSAPHTRKAFGNEIRGLKELVRYASGKDMLIILENVPHPETMTSNDYKYIIQRVPGLGVHIDTGHSFLEGGMKMVSRYLKSFKRLEHLHFSDNLGLSDDHIGIGQGIIDYFRVMEILRKIKYDRTITLEIFSGRNDLRDSLRIIRAIQEEVWPQ